MSTPVGHSVTGISICFLTCSYLPSLQVGGLRKGWKTLVFCIVVACLPDIDFLPGIFVGNINYYHHRGTHSIFFALIVSLTVCAVVRKKAGLKWGLLTFILILSHLAIDYIAIDTVAPFGMPLLWPFSGEYFCSEYAFLPIVVRGSSVLSVFNSHNLRTVIVELIVFLPVALLCYGIRMSPTCLRFLTPLPRGRGRGVLDR